MAAKSKVYYESSQRGKLKKNIRPAILWIGLDVCKNMGKHQVKRVTAVRKYMKPLLLMLHLNKLLHVQSFIKERFMLIQLLF